MSDLRAGGELLNLMAVHQNYHAGQLGDVAEARRARRSDPGAPSAAAGARGGGVRRVIVRYRAEAGRGDENAEYVKKVFEELAASRPEGLRYATFRDEDGVSFTHVASIETDDGSNPLAATEAFKRFQADLKERCDVPPQASTVELIGDYRVFD